MHMAESDETEDFTWTPPGAEPAAAPQQATGPGMQVLSQYVKDMSFENPGAGTPMQRPQISLTADIQVRRAAEIGHFEVILKLRITAQDEGRTLFLLELAYGGVFLLTNIPEADVQPVLLIECPRMLFPFARRIVADVVRDGGLPPFLMEPLDFAALYRRKMAEGGIQNGAPITV